MSLEIFLYTNTVMSDSAKPFTRLNGKIVPRTRFILNENSAVGIYSGSMMNRFEKIPTMDITTVPVSKAIRAPLKLLWYL